MYLYSVVELYMWLPFIKLLYLVLVIKLVVCGLVFVNVIFGSVVELYQWLTLVKVVCGEDY